MPVAFGPSKKCACIWYREKLGAGESLKRPSSTGKRNVPWTPRLGKTRPGASPPPPPAQQQPAESCVDAPATGGEPTARGQATLELEGLRLALPQLEVGVRRTSAVDPAQHLHVEILGGQTRGSRDRTGGPEGECEDLSQGGLLQRERCNRFS